MSAIGENALGGLIASEAHGVIGWVVSLIVKEIKLARGFKKEFEELKDQFGDLSRIIEGASRQRVDNSLMDGWLQKIKDAAEDVDNLLDECSYKALENRIQRRKWSHKIKNTLSKPLSHQDMARKVNNLKESIDSIYKHAQRLGIKPCEVAAAEGCSNGCTNSQDILDTRLQNQRRFVDQTLFLGRDDDKKNLVKLICDPINSNSDLTVIGIVGMAGLGKTTLSKCICKVQEVKEFFDPVISLVISRTFNLRNVLKHMLGNKECPDMSYEQLISELAEKLKNKRYLLILDDVWDTIDWESLRNILNDIVGSHGSVVLVTSRDKNVVENMELQSCCGSEGKVTLKRPTIYPLKGLSEDDSWSLFMARLGDENLVDGNEKKLIAKRLMRNCGGVPLAIRALGDLLRGKSIKRWKEIEESNLWRQDDKNYILPSLRLSYDYLPNMDLKKCFAYCAIFEEDEAIEKHKLIYLWMAQGFLSLQDLQPYEVMEDKGQKYIKDLLNSSLFQEGDDECIMIHDLVWSLARDVSKGQWLCKIKDERSNKVRHLSVPNSSACKEEFEDPTLHFLLKYRYLRVLNLESNWRQDLNWKPLGSLIHLRYLGITLNNDRAVMHGNLPYQMHGNLPYQMHGNLPYQMHGNLPYQITKLYHLQTLVIHIPHPKDQSNPLFPKGLGNLVNLRHILTEFVRIGIPVGLSHLTALQTLPVISLGLNWGGRISDMGLLTNLRGKLEIHCLTLLTTIEEARSLNLGSKSNLDRLVLNWVDGYERADKKNPKANEIVEALQPHENLHKLQLRYFDGTAFPKWLMGPGSPLNNIVSLEIWVCEEADGDLKLENFICLRFLTATSCKKLTVTFPNNKSQCCKSLEELYIVGCDKVEELPDLFLMPKLQVIWIFANNSTSRDVLVGFGSLPYLRELRTDLKLPLDLGKDSHVCKSLKDLSLDGSKYYNGDTTDLPDQLQHLVALQSLMFWNFERVEAIPNWLGKLTSLQSLTLSEMPKLKQLPPQDVMQSLSNLTSLHCSFGCPILEEDFKNKRGEWFKISHIE